MGTEKRRRAGLRRRGTAAVEFALVAPLLLLLIAGVLDFSMGFRTAASVADAARAGAQYGSRSPANAADAAGIRAAVVNAAPGIAGLTAMAAESCQCNGGTASCSGSCAEGLRIYVQVTAQATAPMVFAYSGLPYSGVVTATAAMRAQ